MNLQRLLNKKVQELSASPNWFKYSFTAQKQFILDEAKYKVVQCNRRSGKTFGNGLYMCREAYNNPRVSIIYLATTRMQAKKIMWKDILQQINRQFLLNAKFNEAELTMTFPNGSVIYLEGGDSSYQAAEKIRGQKCKLVVLDEAGSFTNDVEAICNKILIPTLIDYEGTLVMIGTTNNLVNSYFARACMGKVPMFKVFKWSYTDNPHTKRQMENQRKRLMTQDPNVVAEPWFRQEYLNEWIVDSKALIYKHNPDDVMMSTVPDKLTYCLGVTLSYTGHSAFSVIAYTPKSRDAYIVETLKYEDVNLYRAIETIQKFHRVYDLAYITCAEASSRLVEELRKRFSVPIHEAPEKDKTAFLRLFTTELAHGHIKVLNEKNVNKDLISEWNSVIIDDRVSSRMLREHPSCLNHLSTATLYAWNHCYNYLYQPTEESDDPMDTYWESLQESMENGLDERDEFASFYPLPEKFD